MKSPEFIYQSIDIARLIEVALTPIFLISAIGVVLGVLTGRLSRIVDGARSLAGKVNSDEHAADDRALKADLALCERRARLINAAIVLTILSALLTALVVVMLFVNAFLSRALSASIAVMFILSVVTLAAALAVFLIEVRLSAATWRIRFGRSAREDAARRGD